MQGSSLKDIEAATLSDTFWQVAIPQNLCNTSTNNPSYLVYLAAQVAMNDISLLSNNLQVRDLLLTASDVHHVFPKDYLKSLGYERGKYNQVANYAFLDAQVNKSIGKKAPTVYFREALAQCDTGIITCGSITDRDVLMKNLQMNCIPLEVFDMDESRYGEFLEKRRELMAQKIRNHYESL